MRDPSLSLHPVRVKSSLTGVFKLLTDDVVNEERLADDFDLLHSFYGLGDEQHVSEQHTVHVHLEGEVNLSQVRRKHVL